MNSPAYATLMSPAEGLRPRQTAMLGFIREYVGAHGYAPTYSDIATGCGISSVSVVHYNLRALELAGKLRLGNDGSARAIVLTDGGPCPHCGRA